MKLPIEDRLRDIHGKPPCGERLLAGVTVAPRSVSCPVRASVCDRRGS